MVEGCTLCNYMLSYISDSSDADYPRILDQVLLIGGEGRVVAERCGIVMVVCSCHKQHIYIYKTTF